MKILILAILFLGRAAWAQDPPRFQPPRPPTMDQDFEDPADDDIEDMPARPSVPAVPPPGQAQTPPPAMDYSAAPANSAAKADPGKVRFKIVEGEFWEKGKPRGRTPPNKRTQ